MKDGGPVFPYRAVTGQHGKAGPSYTTYPGMSLRDYFAAKAMQGYIAHSGFLKHDDYYAEEAYKIADAMLAARTTESKD